MFNLKEDTPSEIQPAKNLLNRTRVKQNVKSFVKSHKRLLKVSRKLLGRKKEAPMHVYSFIEACTFASDWAYRLPRKYDCIIAIPRAGLAIGQIISQTHNIPLSTPDQFLRGEFWYTHFVPKKNPTPKPEMEKIKTVLLVEDYIETGHEMIRAKKEIQAVYPNLSIETGALMINRNSKSLINQYFCESNGWFLWDLLKGGYEIGTIASDLDGVICEDCPSDMDDDGEKYLTFLRTATPKIIPNFELAAVVTSRREKYRDETEAWLKSHGVRYRNLIMFPNEGPRETKNCAVFKAEGAQKTGAGWFWESDPSTAKSITTIGDLPVFCTADMTIRH